MLAGEALELDLARFAKPELAGRAEEFVDETGNDYGDAALAPAVQR